ncbi:unnamed protein product [Blepharisma stoltei]|uniref:Uncharacterized protein n=1 Tax=Blepharisma stoltei TaxID=1481888 RepID=A0AAU9JRG7_9CILI|nr:unnamed protein product [Blepharisma stoltei]
MKVQRYTGPAKKVFVNIREVPKPSPLSRINQPTIQSRGILIPKPPEAKHEPQFIRKKVESFRCHTPDQGGGKPQSSQILPPLAQKKGVSSVMNSPSRSNSTTKQRWYMPTHFKPKDVDTSILLPKSPIDKEDICMPYELKEKPRLSSRNVEIRKSVKQLPQPPEKQQRVDLRKGSFSKKQIATVLNSVDTSINLSRIEMDSINQSRIDLDISKISLKCDEVFQPWEDLSTNHPSRNPTPDLSTSRPNRFHQLSKGFKLDKQSFVSQVDKQVRRTQSENHSAEKRVKGPQAYTPEPPLLHPWQKFMQDLDDISNITDIVENKQSIESKFIKPKGPIKARHL